ncbi:MAG TPA: hypothetical protein VHG32_19980 [Thermoanaerobaculia bacterium]|jgi:hypothetical protein|nr:hypothetical protein [Thermoanaerobaculia bacterium]
MPSYAKSNPPPWNESDSVRETTLQLLDDPEDREAVRRAGRTLYDLAVVATREVGAIPGDPSITRAELRAVAADLRYTGGYLLYVIRRSAKDCDLDPEDDKLARFAGKVGRRVGALAAAIEGRLS